MGILESIGKLASEAVKKKDKPKTNDNSERWEKRDLKDTEKIMKQNAKWDKEKSKTGWTNPQTGDSFSKEHYKNNYSNDMEAIKRVQNEMKKRRLAKSLKERNERINRDIKIRKRDKIDDYLED